MSAGCAGLETNLRRCAAMQLQNLLITNKKRRTRKDRARRILFGSGGALCTLARSPKPLVVLDVPLIAA
jgi:hypothetical protein